MRAERQNGVMQIMPEPNGAGFLNDEELLALYGAGDAEAARLIADRLLPRVLRHAARMLGGDQAEAEDLAQEAMLRLWRAAPGWRAGEAKVTTWLYRVVANLAVDRLRAGRNRRATAALGEVPEPEDGMPSAQEVMQSHQRLSALDEALSALPERQREAVILRHIEGLSNPEIAQIMGIGVEAVESLTARGKRALAAILAPSRESLGYEEG